MAKVSRTRSKKSKQRDKEDRKKAAPRRWPLTRILLAALLWASVLALIHAGGNYSSAPLATGQKAPATVVSIVAFNCLDLAQTELARQEAGEAVLPVFSVQTAGRDTANRSLDKLFSHVISARTASDDKPSRGEIEDLLGEVLELVGISLKPSELLRLVPETQEVQLRDVIKASLAKRWYEGIASSTQRSTAFQGLAPADAIAIEKSPGDDIQTSILLDVPLPEEARDLIVDDIVADFAGRQRLSRSYLAALVEPWAVPNLTYNPLRTAELRDRARAGVPTVMTTIPSGMTLVEAGERVTPAVQEKLRTHQERIRVLETPIDHLFRVIADGSLLMIMLVVCVGLLQVMKPDVLQSKSKILLLVILSLLALVPAKGLVYISHVTGWIPPTLIRFLLPLGLTSLLATILLNVSAALVIGTWTSFAAALLLGHDFKILTMGLLVTVVAAHAAKNVHRRGSLFRAGLWVGLAEILCVLTLAVLDQPTLPVILIQAGTGLLNGLFCAVLVLLLIPLFELTFNITTDITLLELSDMGSPLLQRLAIEAPGTYHHSLMVANLAQHAAQDIGAHALLIRVAAYYHDIGKLTKPEFFIENTQFRDNPHDDLQPSMSTLVVTSHVKEGVTLALRHKLPRVVIDAIQQHHGSGLVSYFYHRAKEQKKTEESTGAQTNGAVQEEDYRYPGPRPMTPEMGILSLADSVEAASRSMEKPTASRIENLVNEIVNGKLQDGQLDECNLTLAELATIKRSFVFTLTNMLHGRIAYPQDENRNKQQTGKVPGASTEAGATAPGTDAASTRS